MKWKGDKSTEQDLILKFLDKNNVFAVVGVSKNPEKYGHKGYRDLSKAEYKVYSINPNINEILGNKCYANLFELPEVPDVVDVVVPPNVTEKIVDNCKKLGIRKVWLQQGSESKRAIEFCKNNEIEVLYDICIMVEWKEKRWNEIRSKKEI